MASAAITCAPGSISCTLSGTSAKQAAAPVGGHDVHRLARKVRRFEEHAQRCADGVVPDGHHQPHRVVTAQIFRICRQLQFGLVDVLTFAHFHGLVIVGRIGVCRLDREYVRSGLLRDPPRDHLGIPCEFTACVNLQAGGAHHIDVRVKYRVANAGEPRHQRTVIRARNQAHRLRLLRRIIRIARIVFDLAFFRKCYR